MKHLKRIGALLVVLALMLTLVACGASDEEKLVGTWKCEYDMTDIMTEQLASLGDSADFSSAEPLIATMLLTINEDKTFSFKLDADATGASFEDYIASILDAMVEAAYAQGEAQGVDRETFDENFQSTYGSTVKEFFESLFSSLDFASLFGEMEDVSGVFKAKDGKLYFEEEEADFSEDNYITYKLEDTKLTFESLTGDTLSLDEDVEAGVEFPMLFVKQ